MVLRLSCLLAIALAPSAVNADGLFYQLPDDGNWVRYELAGTGTEVAGEVSTFTGTLTLSSVGVSEVDGRKCRWIEIVQDGKAKRSGEPYQAVHKLLIQEENLVPGDEPLNHVVKAWYKHSQVGPDARVIDDLQGRGARSLQSLDFILHGPFESQRELEPVRIESKLGELDCAGISAFDVLDLGNGVTMESNYIIRRHEKAPFGVVTMEGERRVRRAGEFLGTMTMKMTLIDCGTDAQSILPDAK